MATTKPLEGLRGVSLAINIPGPVAARRLADMGMCFIKVEPPSGDPLRHMDARCYDEMTAGMEIITLDLKAPEGRARLDELLAEADVAFSATRPAALARLGLAPEDITARFPRLCWVAITGFAPPNENEAGHDLTYQAALGTIDPPHMPRVLLADMAGAARATEEALALLVQRARTGKGGYVYAALADAAHDFAVTIRYGVTTPGGLLGGGLPNYTIYPTAQGHLACAALEPHFLQRLMQELEITTPGRDTLAAVFLQRTAREWEDWARERDLPLAAIITPGEESAS